MWRLPSPSRSGISGTSCVFKKWRFSKDFTNSSQKWRYSPPFILWGRPLLSLLRSFTVGILPPLHPAKQGITPRRRLPRPPRGPASPRRVRVRYFYPNLASTCLIKLGRHTTVGSHSTAATNRRSRAPSVKLVIASQLVPADVIRYIIFISAVLMGIPQQALLKAYEEAAAEEE